jgi:hypothetical protein
VLTPTLSDKPFNRKFKMAAVKRKFPYIGLYVGQNINFKGKVGNTISNDNTTFSRVANTTERRPTPNTSCI